MTIAFKEKLQCNINVNDEGTSVTYNTRNQKTSFTDKRGNTTILIKNLHIMMRGVV